YIIHLLRACDSPLFLFYCYRAHPDLHSFPTRRSSDLAGLPVALLATNFLPKVWQVAEHHPGLKLIIDHLGRRSPAETGEAAWDKDRKSTRLNSSHVRISYAVFCLKKKKKNKKKMKKDN